MKLNLGCGANAMPGWVNVDRAGSPDVVWDLEQTPWPWAESSAEEILFNHSLEHMGADPDVFFAIICEIWRVAAPDAVVRINAPHPRHDNFLNDPTHVRAITPDMLTLFNKAQNEEWVRAGASNSPLALRLGIDFELFDVFLALDEPYAAQLKSGALTPAEVSNLARERNNVISEFRIQMYARKPVRQD